MSVRARPTSPDRAARSACVAAHGRAVRWRRTPREPRVRLHPTRASPRRARTGSTTLDVNMVSAVMATKAVLPHLRSARWKAPLVNFASISANVAQTGRWLYPVSKAAIVQLTRNMAMDLATDGVSRQRRLTGVDLVEDHGRSPPETTARRPIGSRRRTICSVASAIRRRWRTSSRSCSPTTRAS